MKNLPALIVCAKGIIAIFIGLLFKLMHWPGGTALIAIGLPIVLVGVLLFIFLPTKKNGGQNYF